MNSSVAAAAKAELAFDAAGTEDSNLDVVLAELGVEGLAEADLRELRGRVDGFTGDACETGYRGDEENGAAALRDHQGRGVAGEEEAGLYVGVHHGVVVFGRGVDEIFIAADAGIVDEDVEGAEGAGDEGNCGEGGGFVGGVSVVEDGVATAGVDLRAESCGGGLRGGR